MLSASDSGGWSRQFAFDQYGNMALAGNSGVPLYGTTPIVQNGVSPFNAANNRLLSGTYDQAGNQTVNGSLYLYYDAEAHQSTSYDSITGIVTNYYYDDQGRRVINQTINGPTTVYVYDALGQKVADYSTAASSSPCQTCYMTYDHLGSMRVVTDQNGSVMGIHDYLPFGEEIPAGWAGRGSQFGASDNVAQKFTGKERDWQSGLDYFGARYYGSVLGRFTSPDPVKIMKQKLLDPQQWNAYSYARNNPLRFTDPTGLYVVNCASNDKDCNKAANRFEKARQKDLKSRHEDVRNAADAWGPRSKEAGDAGDNGISVTFKSQKDVDADAGTKPGYSTQGFVRPGANRGQPNIQAEFSESVRGSDLRQLIGHEGSHVGDDLGFISSFNASTGRYDREDNFTHRDTEFNAFETGSQVKPYIMFAPGPKGEQQLMDYINKAYADVADQLVFPPSVFPQ